MRDCRLLSLGDWTLVVGHQSWVEGGGGKHDCISNGCPSSIADGYCF